MCVLDEILFEKFNDILIDDMEIGEQPKISSSNPQAPTNSNTTLPTLKGQKRVQRSPMIWRCDDITVDDAFKM